MSIDNIGRLNKKVDIIAGEQGKYEKFDSIEKKVLYKNIWAAVKPSRGIELFERMKGRGESVPKPLRNEESCVITIRYREDITEGCRVRYRGILYDVKSIVDPDMTHESLELYCVEKKRGNIQRTSKMPESEAWVP